MSYTFTVDDAVARGWSVIPTNAEKKPLLTSWKPFQDRKPSETEVENWKRINPSAWASITGEISGFITLDFDGEPGRETLEKLGIAPHRKTPSGGFHVDFEHPGWKVQTLNGKASLELGKRYPGLDIRGDGGYVCFTGHTSRGAYEWLRDPEPYFLDILPADLREYLGLMHPPEAPEATPANGIAVVPRAALAQSSKGDARISPDRLISDAFLRVRSGGGRNNAGFWLACQLRDNGYNEATTRVHMRTYQSACPSTNKKGQREPYTAEEAMASVQEAYSKGARTPWASKRTVANLQSEPQPAEAFDSEAPIDAQPEGAEDLDSVNWRELLIKGPPTKNGPGGVKAILANAITALRFSPDWQGVLGYNQFALSAVALQPPPWRGSIADRWTDNDDRLTANWLQHEGIFVGVQLAGLAVQTVAMESRFHPVRDYLDGLEWDKEKRLDSWLSTYAGATETDYVKAVGSRWMIAAIARIYKPGCKADCMLILEGKQGILKSTLFNTLAGEWFTDEIADLGSKDASMQTAGVWIIEVAELDSMSRPESARIKAFMSRTTDRFRPPYGKHVQEAPRQCIFAGTVNHASYLKDETGGRRFWPVPCGKIDIAALKKDRDQLWAEAVHRLNAGEKWWLDTAELNQQAAVEQAERYEGDAWDELITPWIANPEQRYDSTGHPILPFTSTPDAVTVPDILTHAIGKRQDQWTHADANRVARSLKSMNWCRFQQRIDDKRAWKYRREP